MANDAIPIPYNQDLDLTTSDHINLYLKEIKVTDETQRYEFNRNGWNNFFQYSQAACAEFGL